MSPIYKLAVIFSAIDQMTGPTKKIAENVRTFDNMIKHGKGMSEYGKNLSVSGAMVQGAADKMVNSLKDIMAPTQEINDALASLETVTTSTMGTMEKSMTTSRKAAKQWSRIHSDSAATFLKTSTIIAGAGLNDVQAIEGTRVALTVAKATFGEAGEAAELLGVLYNNMADKTKDVRAEMTRLGDVVTVTQQLFQIKNLSQLNEGLKYAVPTALQFKTSLEEVSTVLGMLNTSGLAGGQAGTAYAATMRQMIRASDELGFAIGRNKDGGISLIKTVENIRKKYGEFGSMSDYTKVKFQRAFGDEGLRAIALLLGKTDDLNKSLIAVTNSTGEAARAQKLIEVKSPTEQYQIMQNNIDAVKDSLAVNLLPTINKMLPSIIKLIDGFGKFVEKHPGLAKLVITTLALGAGILSVVAPIMTVGGSILTVTGYGVQGFGKIMKGALALHKFLASGKLLTGVKALGGGLTQFFRMGAMAIWGAVKAAWGFTAALLANPITWIVIGVIALIAAIVLLIKNWKKVTEFMTSVWTRIRSIWGGMPGWAKNLVTVLLLVFMPFIGIPLLIARNWKTLGPAIGRIFRMIVNWFKPLPQMALNWGRNLLGNFVKGFQSRTAALKKGVQGVARTIKRFLGFHSPAEEGPGSTAHQWAPNLIKMYTSGLLAGINPISRAALGLAMSVFMAMNQSPAPFSMGFPGFGGSSPKSSRLIQVANADSPNKREIHVHFHGPVTIQTEKPEDFFNQLKQIAEEVG